MSLQDQPERRSSNSVMLGGSTYTACWGVSTNINAVASHVSACANCFSSLTMGTINSQCSTCVNWDLRRDSSLLYFPAPDHYPHCLIADGTGMLKPLILTYDMLKEAVQAAHNGFVHDGWSPNNLKTYLPVHGINSEAVQGIFECAKNCKAVIDLPEDDPQRVALIMKQRTNPELFTMWKFLSLWSRNVKLCQHIDVIMHLVFLGVVKTTMQKFLESFALRGKQASFLKYSNSLLESVQQLRLSWCKCIPCKTGKFGGWVSENYLGAARIFAWLYSYADFIAPDISDLSILNLKPQQRWTRKENYNWLVIRGQDTSGNAVQLRDLVNNLMNRPEGYPPVLTPTGGPVSVVQKVASALQAMVCRIMSLQPDVYDCELHIKYFLSYFETFDRAMRRSNESPS